MKRSSGTAIKMTALFLIMIAICASTLVSALERNIPENHPLELKESPWCTDCHSDDTGVAMKPIEAFSHGADFIDRHRFYAAQSSPLCGSCHRQAFCADCHGNKDTLKPSDKYPGSPDRWLPHRGDYLYQHRIDGRIDPLRCYRCHGRQNNGSCKRCHK